MYEIIIVSEFEPEPLLIPCERVIDVLRKREIGDSDAIKLYYCWFEQEKKQMQKGLIDIFQFYWKIMSVQRDGGYMDVARESLQGMINFGIAHCNQEFIKECKRELEKIKNIRDRDF